MSETARPARILYASIGRVVGAAALLLAVWWAVAALRFGGEPILATPLEVARELLRVPTTLLLDLAATAGRAGLGLLIGVVAGIPLGLAAAALARVLPPAEGLLDFARSVPPAVLLPAFLLAFGYDDTARVATIAVGCVWTMALAVTTAAAAPRSGRRELLALAGAGRARALLWTQPWESLGVLVVGLRASASTAVIVAVVTEMLVGASHGIGSRVVSAQIAGDTAELTLDIVGVGLLGYAVNVGLRALETAARRLER